MANSRHRFKWLLVAAFLGGGLQVLSAQTLVNLDFETATDFGDNFRFTFNSATTNTVQSSNGAANDFVTTTLSSGSDNEVFVYDTTPANATVKNTFNGPIQIEADIKTAQASSSFGFYIVDSANESSASHQLALFNWDGTSTFDRLRIFTATTILGSAVGPLAYDSGLPATVNSGSNAGDTAFTHMTLTYMADTVDPTKAVLNLTVGTMSTGNVVLGANSLLSNFEIGLRSFDVSTTAGGTSFDNVAITQVPEPSTFFLLGAGICSLLFLKKLRSR